MGVRGLLDPCVPLPRDAHDDAPKRGRHHAVARDPLKRDKFAHHKPEPAEPGARDTWVDRTRVSLDVLEKGLKRRDRRNRNRDGRPRPDDLFQPASALDATTPVSPRPLPAPPVYHF